MDPLGGSEQTARNLMELPPCEGGKRHYIAGVSLLSHPPQKNWKTTGTPERQRTQTGTPRRTLCSHRTLVGRGRGYQLWRPVSGREDI